MLELGDLMYARSWDLISATLIRVLWFKQWRCAQEGRPSPADFHASQTFKYAIKSPSPTANLHTKGANSRTSPVGPFFSILRISNTLLSRFQEVHLPSSFESKSWSFWSKILPDATWQMVCMLLNLENFSENIGFNARHSPANTL